MSTQSARPEATTARANLHDSLSRWFFTPPRIHGEVDNERKVSFLELFYDLAYVVLVGQISHHLAAHPSWHGIAQFTVLFSMTWVAWFNGSLYHETHGREDGRHRSYIFGQMWLLVPLAVFAGDAGGETSTQFALVFSLLMLLIAYQWWVVHLHDVVEVFRIISRNYVIGMLVMIAIVLGSLLAPEEVRLWIWAGSIAAMMVVIFTLNHFTRPEDADAGTGLAVTDSMVERFGLFTIIVLGEVLVGVTNGILDAGASTVSIATGMAALLIGFGFWWNYFDVVGMRLPRVTPRAMLAWMMLHLPLTASIVASGAGMVSLIEHSGEHHVPTETSFLLVGGSAALLLCISALVFTLDVRESVRAAIRIFQVALWVGAVVCVGVGFLNLSALPLAICLGLTHMLVWGAAFYVQSTTGLHTRLAAEDF